MFAIVEIACKDSRTFEFSYVREHVACFNGDQVTKVALDLPWLALGFFNIKAKRATRSHLSPCPSLPSAGFGVGFSVAVAFAF